MTHEELDALPVSGAIEEIVETLPDGTKRSTMKMGNLFALYHRDDDPILVRDRFGVAWSVGWAGGVRYKTRSRL